MVIKSCLSVGAFPPVIEGLTPLKANKNTNAAAVSSVIADGDEKLNWEDNDLRYKSCNENAGREGQTATGTAWLFPICTGIVFATLPTSNQKIRTLDIKK